MGKAEFLHMKIDGELKKEAMKKAEQNYQTLTEYIKSLIEKIIKKVIILC